MRLGQILPFAALPFVFALGWWSHPGAELQVSDVQQTKVFVSDTVRVNSSSARGNPVDTAVADRSIDISDVKKRDALEGTIRGVPFSFLKQIYLERQDAEWKKSEEYYQQIPLEDSEAMKRQTDELFKQFQRNSAGASFFTTTSEWTLRGGKRVPIILFGQIYSSRGDQEGMVTGDPTLATRGDEICYMVTAYFKIGETEGSRYASEGTGSCLNWVATREGKPFILLNSNSKSLVPYFDRVSVPLPGFGSDFDSEPQWYNSNQMKWSRLARVRWNPISKDEFARNKVELQAVFFRN